MCARRVSSAFVSRVCDWLCCAGARASLPECLSASVWRCGWWICIDCEPWCVPVICVCGPLFICEAELTYVLYVYLCTIVCFYFCANDHDVCVTVMMCMTILTWQCCVLELLCGSV